MTGCETCRHDWDYLRLGDRPDYEARPSRSDSITHRVSLVDLFCGCGGLSLGIAEAARQLGAALEIPLAIDTDSDSLAVFAANFPHAKIEQKPVEELLNGALGAPLTAGEKELKDRVGRVDILTGGPPCQGHSDLNNHTRRTDPRNALYERMARAAEVLEPSIVLIENVPAVVRDAAGVVDTVETALTTVGYTVNHKTLNLGELGVPQRRRRHILLACSTGSLDPGKLLSELTAPCADHPARSVRWAIEDLEDTAISTSFDAPPSPTSENAARIAWLFDNDKYDLPNLKRPRCHRDKKHSYSSMYGRLRWDDPAQTITTGFGSMGQGRYVHPSRRRTITPHEAARLQSFPDFFDFSALSTRTALARLIGNTVPPLLSCNIASVVIPHLTKRQLGLAA